MEMLIIGTGCALGYYMGKDGKRKTIAPHIQVSKHDIPSGPLIYESNRVKQVDDQIRELAKPKHQEKVKRMFPHDYSKPQTVFSRESEEYAMGAPVNFNTDSTQQQFANTISSVAAKDPNYLSYNPETAQAFAFKNVNVDNSPMFRNNLQYQSSGAYTEPTGNVSLLSGIPTNFTHTNMQPMFSSRNKQNGVENDNSQHLLERYTGVPSTDNAGTYSKKVERPGFVNQGDIYKRPDINALTNRYERAVNAVKPENNLYNTPFEPQRELPFQSDKRVLPKSIDETRISNPKLVYNGVVVQGQKGSTRGYVGSTRDFKSLFTESDVSNYIGNKSSITSKAAIATPNIHNLSGNQEYENNYMGPQTSNITEFDYHNSTNMHKNTLNNTVTRQIGVHQPEIVSMTGLTKNKPSIGGFTVKQQHKEYQTPNGQAYLPNATANRDVNEFKTTIKDITSKNTVGPINPTSTFMTESAYRYDVENMNLVPTSKQMLSKNDYIGQGHWDKGMGITQNTVENFTTSKETLLHDQSKKGSKRSEVGHHMSYDSVFAGSGNYSETLVKDYMSNGKSTNATGSQIERGNFNESVDVYEGRLEFGNHFNGGQMGDKGTDMRREEEYRVKDNTTVEGRVNPTLRHDNVDKYLDTNVYLKDNVESLDSKLVTKLPPIGEARLQPQVRIKDELIQEDRLDSSVRISNDMYPWIKK